MRRSACAEGTAPGPVTTRTVRALQTRPTSRTRVSRREVAAGGFAAWIFWLLAVLLVGVPFCVSAVRLAGHEVERDAVIGPGGWMLLASTLGWAAGIGVVSMALAVPAACVLRARGWSVAPMILVPLTLPSYLSYSALSMARAPGTVLGDWVEFAAQRGSKDIPIIAGQVLALTGLSLWAWPISALVAASQWRLVEQTVLDSLRLEQASPARRLWQLAIIGRRGLILGTAAVALVMLGSAVPLHLAQVRTYSMEVWSRLALEPGNAGVWLSAWPLILAAFGAALIFSARAPGRGREIHAMFEFSNSRTRGALIATTLIWITSTLLPLALFAFSVRSWSTLGVLWRYAGGAVVNSLLVSALVGAGAVVLMCLAWFCLSEVRSPVVRAAMKGGVFLWLCGAIMPGVLMGAAVRSAALVCESVPGFVSLLESPLILAAGHLSRFGALPVLAGLWMAAAEPAEHLALRRLDGSVSLKGWMMGCLWAHWGVVAAVGIGASCLSLHEIEASVILQPAGTPSLAQILLGYLHFSRTEELSVAAVVLVGASLLASLVAAVLAKHSLRSESM